MKTKEEWNRSWYARPIEQTDIPSFVEAIQRDAWLAATKAQMERVEKHAQDVQCEYEMEGIELAPFPDDKPKEDK